MGKEVYGFTRQLVFDNSPDPVADSGSQNCMSFDCKVEPCLGGFRLMFSFGLKDYSKQTFVMRSKCRDTIECNEALVNKIRTVAERKGYSFMKSLAVWDILIRYWKHCPSDPSSSPESWVYGLEPIPKPYVVNMTKALDTFPDDFPYTHFKTIKVHTRDK